MQGRDYLVIDVEATCDDHGAVPREEMEIIEIGAVYVDGRRFTITGEYQTFIRPVRHPTLTPFCTGLTSITQAEVDAAPGFVQAITALRAFIDAHRGRGRPPLFSSWGGYDRNQFKQDAAFHRVELPFGGEHLNLKRAFTEALKSRKNFGMAGALKRLDIPLDGTHHRGIDDARNIAKILPYAIGARPMPPPPKGWHGKE
ncbi:MAG: 3'-5' exonuclease [bacterium]